jgi:hypothetical protein
MPKQKIKIARFTFQAACLVFLVLSFLFLRSSVKIVEGATTFNVAGYAWSSNFGWVSMNCQNNNTCSTNGGYDYGVNINPNTYTCPNCPHNLDGYAWSPNAGWISFRFNGGDPNPPDNWRFASTSVYCYDTNCTSGNGCTACFNPETGKIYGWARVLNQGANGWIALGTTSETGIKVDQTSASGTFSGFGWNGNTDKAVGLGWLSFNCNNSPYFNTCAAYNYSVYIKNHTFPVPTILSAPNWNFAQACPQTPSKTGVALRAILQWHNPGYMPTAYQVVFNTNNSTSSAPAYNTGKRRVVGISSFIVSSTAAIVTYDQRYYWWVKVWDDFGFPSTWRQFNTSTPGDLLTDNVARNKLKGNSKTFSTYLHEMPEANFNANPLPPLAYEPSTTTDASFYFTTSSPSTAIPCTTARCSWYWTGSSTITNSATTSTSTVMTFNYTHHALMNLKITDRPTTTYDTYYCVSSTPYFFVDLLPFWREKQTQ